MMLFPSTADQPGARAALHCAWRPGARAARGTREGCCPARGRTQHATVIDTLARRQTWGSRP
eukprot:2183810-Prymnesium_polylepis.1